MDIVVDMSVLKIDDFVVVMISCLIVMVPWLIAIGESYWIF